MIKKVLLLSDASSVHTKRWEEGYTFLGWDVYTVSFEKKLYDFKNFEEINVRVKNNYKYLIGYFKLKDVIEKVKPDIIFPHFIPNYGLLSFFEKIRKKIPYVLTIWGSDLLIFPYKNKFKNLLTKFILKNSNGIVVDAKFMKEKIKEDFKIEEEKIFVIPFGVKKDLRELGKKKKFEEDGKVGIITYRKMEPIYNQEIIIKALKIFKDEERKYFYVDFLGTGSLYNKFKEMIYNEGLFDIVNFNGYVDDKRLISLLLKDSIYLSASFSDGTSVSLIEALTFGLFPVVSDIKGNREWVLDNVNGFLFNPNDKKELYLKLKRAIMDKNLRKEAFSINKRIIEERANWEENLISFKEFVIKRI
jgi:glycosyltransferase involved in cell wall biosynthesis